MVVAALLSAIHMLTLALGLGGIVLRGRALSGSLDDAGWTRLLVADNGGTALPRFSLVAYRRINAVEIALIVGIVFAAAFMARGAWLF